MFETSFIGEKLKIRVYNMERPGGVRSVLITSLEYGYARNLTFKVPQTGEDEVSLVVAATSLPEPERKRISYIKDINKRYR